MENKFISYSEWQRSVLEEIDGQVDFVYKKTDKCKIVDALGLRNRAIIDILSKRHCISIETILDIARHEDDVRQTLDQFLTIIDKWEYFKIHGKESRLKFRQDMVIIIQQIYPY